MSGNEELLNRLRAQMNAVTGEEFIKVESQENHVAAISGCDMSNVDIDPIVAELEADEKHQKPKMSAFQRVVFLLGYCARFSHELQRRLIREGYPEAEAVEAVQKACSLGLINDAAHAEAVVRNTLSQGKELNLIRMELKAKGVDCARYPFWKEISCEQSGELSFQRALDYAKRHPGTGKNPTESLRGKLLRRGFSYGVVQRVVNYLGETAIGGAEA